MSSAADAPGERRRGLLSFDRALVVLLLCIAVGVLLRSDYSPVPLVMDGIDYGREKLFGDLSERHWRHSLSLTSKALHPREMNAKEALRFDDSVPHSFPGSQEFPILEWRRDTYDIEAVTDAGVPVLIKGTPAERWEAVEAWNDGSGYFFESNGFHSIDVHCPSEAQVRLHSPDEENQPLGKHGVDSKGMGDRMWAATAAGVAAEASDIRQVVWRRQPWVEAEVPVHWFWDYAGQRLLYVMAKLEDLPAAVREAVGSLVYAKLPWSPPLETNVWMGTPQVSTPLHYDMVHNFYTQVVGKKRWIVIPPVDAAALHVFPAIHPSDRMSQVDINSLESDGLDGVEAYEVVLEPGDVLYIPPFFFHHVTVVHSEAPSISVSTHSESHQAWLRERIMAKTERMLGKLATKSDRDWDLDSGARALWHYFSSVLACFHDPHQFVADLVTSRWEPLAEDAGVEGLWDLLSAAPAISVADVEAVMLSQVELEVLDKNAADMAGVFNALNPLTGRDIMLANHVEFFSSMLLGELHVLPFLRAVGQLKPSPAAPIKD